MELIEGYYDCVPERTVNERHGSCTAYTAYMNGQPSFTLYLYDKSPNMISIHEGGYNETDTDN
tara:strand:- start:2620 stop:2808 length:189 start_codon:yes stop_codon:yes gene_type:complete